MIDIKDKTTKDLKHWMYISSVNEWDAIEVNYAGGNTIKGIYLGNTIVGATQPKSGEDSYTLDDYTGIYVLCHGTFGRVEVVDLVTLNMASENTFVDLRRLDKDDIVENDKWTYLYAYALIYKGVQERLSNNNNQSTVTIKNLTSADGVVIDINKVNDIGKILNINNGAVAGLYHYIEKVKKDYTGVKYETSIPLQ